MTREKKILPKEDLPCHEGDDEGFVSVKDCTEDFFERNASCSLPWRRGVNGHLEPCETEEHFKAYYVFFDSLIFATNKQIFDKTGCYQKCSFKVSSIWKIATQ